MSKPELASEETFNEDGATALMLVSQSNDAEKASEIIESQRCQVTGTDKSGRTALHYAADANALTCAELLLKHCPELLEMQDSDGCTALHLAVISGHLSTVTWLVQQGANVTGLDGEGHNALHWATVSGHCDLLDYLMTGLEVKAVADRHGAYPLHYAAQLSAQAAFGENTVKKLISCDHPIDCKDGEGRIPLLWAASAGAALTCKILVICKSEIDSRDKDGLTALHCAASRGHLNCVKTLIIKCGATVDSEDKNKCTPLFYAATFGHRDVVQFLLASKADPLRMDRKGRTASHCAAANGAEDVMDLLEDAGADIWVCSQKGSYPIGEAIDKGHFGLARSLARNAEFASIRRGRTALHSASSGNLLEMCKHLLDNGAHVNALYASSSTCITPYDAAVRHNALETAAYLQSRGGTSAESITRGAARTIQKNFRLFRMQSSQDTQDSSDTEEQPLTQESSPQDEKEKETESTSTKSAAAETSAKATSAKVTSAKETPAKTSAKVTQVKTSAKAPPAKATPAKSAKLTSAPSTEVESSPKVPNAIEETVAKPNTANPNSTEQISTEHTAAEEIPKEPPQIRTESEDAAAPDTAELAENTEETKIPAPAATQVAAVHLKPDSANKKPPLNKAKSTPNNVAASKSASSTKPKSGTQKPKKQANVARPVEPLTPLPGPLPALLPEESVSQQNFYIETTANEDSTVIGASEPAGDAPSDRLTTRDAQGLVTSPALLPPPQEEEPSGPDAPAAPAADTAAAAPPPQQGDTKKLPLASRGKLKAETSIEKPKPKLDTRVKSQPAKVAVPSATKTAVKPASARQSGATQPDATQNVAPHREVEENVGNEAENSGDLIEENGDPEEANSNDEAEVSKHDEMNGHCSPHTKETDKKPTTTNSTVKNSRLTATKPHTDGGGKARVTSATPHRGGQQPARGGAVPVQRQLSAPRPQRSATSRDTFSQMSIHINDGTASSSSLTTEPFVASREKLDDITPEPTSPVSAREGPAGRLSPVVSAGRPEPLSAEASNVISPRQATLQIPSSTAKAKHKPLMRSNSDVPLPDISPTNESQDLEYANWEARVRKSKPMCRVKPVRSVSSSIQQNVIQYEREKLLINHLKRVKRLQVSRRNGVAPHAVERSYDQLRNSTILLDNIPDLDNAERSLVAEYQNNANSRYEYKPLPKAHPRPIDVPPIAEALTKNSPVNSTRQTETAAASTASKKQYAKTYQRANEIHERRVGRVYSARPAPNPPLTDSELNGSITCQYTTGSKQETAEPDKESNSITNTARPLRPSRK